MQKVGKVQKRRKKSQKDEMFSFDDLIYNDYFFS